MIVQETHSEMAMLSYASHLGPYLNSRSNILFVDYPGTREYTRLATVVPVTRAINTLPSPSIWAPGARRVEVGPLGCPPRTGTRQILKAGPYNARRV